MQTRGYTLLELIIVVAILSVLVGISVPYYQDYIIDSRRHALKANLENMRKVIGEFRGDNGRGPYRVPVQLNNTTILLQDPKANTASGSELVGGAIQYINNTWQRRKNVKYLNALPVFEDPQTGAQLDWSYGSPSAYFEDFDADGRFDIDTEFAYNGASNIYVSSTDRIISRALTATGTTFIPLDYTNVTVTTSEGPM